MAVLCFVALALTFWGFAFGRVSEHKASSFHVTPPDAKPVLPACALPCKLLFAIVFRF